MAVSRNTGRAEKKPYIGQIFPTAHFPASPRVRLWRPIERIDGSDDLRAIAFLAEQAEWSVPYQMYRGVLDAGHMGERIIVADDIMQSFATAVRICRMEDDKRIREAEAVTLCTHWIQNEYRNALEDAARRKKWALTWKSNAYAETQYLRPSGILCRLLAAALPPLQVQEKGIKAYLKKMLIKEAEIEAEIQAKAAGTLLIDTD